MNRHQKQLISLIKNLPGPEMRGAEIGVSRGETSEILLRRFPGLFLYMVDSWKAYPPWHSYRRSGDRCARLTIEEQNRIAENVVHRTEFAQGRREILRMDSLEAAEQLVANSLDIVFIDADHTYESVRADLNAWYDKVRVGGIFCGHDYGGPRDRRGRWGVTRAVDEFAQENCLTISVANGTIWWTRRNGSPIG